MPLTDLEQKFYAGQFAMEFKSPNSSWSSYIDDRTSEIGIATSLDIDQVTTSATARTYNPAAASPIASTDYAGAEKATLTMTNWDYTSVGYKEYQQAHSRANLLTPMAQEAARVLGEKYNAHIYDVLGKRTDTDIGAARTPIVLTQATTAFDTAATRKKLVEELHMMKYKFTERGVDLPLGVICPNIIPLQLGKYWIFDNPVVGTGSANDAAWVNGLVQQVFGLTLMGDVLNAGTHAAAGTKQYPIYVFPLGYGIAGAMRMVANREIQVETDFETRVQTLARYGASVYDPSVIEEINYTFS